MSVLRLKSEIGNQIPANAGIFCGKLKLSFIVIRCKGVKQGSLQSSGSDEVRKKYGENHKMQINVNAFARFNGKLELHQ